VRCLQGVKARPCVGAAWVTRRCEHAPQRLVAPNFTELLRRPAHLSAASRAAK